jgi:mannose-6-phosphate isomerase-like protein (cupin superfamily)
MRYVAAFCLFIFLIGCSGEAQVLPTSNGSCGISASGVESCNWISAITLREAFTAKTVDTSADSRPRLFVTHCSLAPGAPLTPLVEGTDELIVAMNNGELVNAKKSPENHIEVSSGFVMLMPKEEPYLLKNIGKENLELLVIEVRR